MLMDQSTPGCIVEYYYYLIPKLNLPDPKDNHILASAIHSKAPIIVTFNLKDFSFEILNQYRIESMHPDDFI